MASFVSSTGSLPASASRPVVASASCTPAGRTAVGLAKRSAFTVASPAVRRSFDVTESSPLVLASADGKSIVIAGGGTGGHVLPALAMADAFKKALGPSTEILFVGTERGIEKTLVPKRNYEIELIPGAPIVTGGSIFTRLAKLFAGLFALIAGVIAAYKLLKKRKPNLVLGVGGYASAAAVIAAKILGIRTALHESNAVPGLTNKLLGSAVDRVYVGFDAAKGAFPAAKTVVTGNPVRPEIAATWEVRRKAMEEQGAKARLPAHVLVVGGSQGSQFLNERVPALVEKVKLGIRYRAARRGHLLPDPIVKVLHQAGRREGEAAATAAAYAAIPSGVEAEVREFVDDMDAKYTWADVVVSRSGASTISELAAAGVPSFLVPYPAAAGDHQALNAAWLSDKGAASWMRQGSWDDDEAAERLVEMLYGSAGTREKLVAVAEAAHAVAHEDGAAAVVRDAAALLAPEPAPAPPPTSIPAPRRAPLDLAPALSPGRASSSGCQQPQCLQYRAHES
eukprot:tig00021795_g23530.t1